MRFPCHYLTQEWANAVLIRELYDNIFVQSRQNIPFSQSLIMCPLTCYFLCVFDKGIVKVF